MQIIGDFTTSVKKALSEIDPKYMDYPGLVVCGSHTPHDTERMISEIVLARVSKLPALLICLGYQLAAIEYARNVLRIQDATSEEFGTGTFVVKKRPNLKVGLHNGETYWNNYEVDLPDWKLPPHFFGSQSHPEYQSSKSNPHPLLVSFIDYARKMASQVVANIG